MSDGFADYGNYFVGGQVSFNGTARMARWRLDQVIPADRIKCGERHAIEFVYRTGERRWYRQAFADNRLVCEELM